jgi:hypothetical protein
LIAKPGLSEGASSPLLIHDTIPPHTTPLIDHAYLVISQAMKAELSSHPEDHTKLISLPAQRPRRKTRNQPTYAEEVVQELMVRLDNEEISCTEEYWLRMLSLGFVIASAFDRPVIILTPSESNCYSFFPYRTSPNKQAPIVLAFINNIHFVSLRMGHHLVPFPGVYGQVRNAAMLETTQVHQWISHYKTEFEVWTSNTSTNV